MDDRGSTSEWRSPANSLMAGIPRHFANEIWTTMPSNILWPRQKKSHGNSGWQSRWRFGTIVEAVHRHFRHEHEQIQRRLREHLRRGQISLAVGLTMLVVFLALAGFTRSLPSGAFQEILREGFVITGWVAMWRPLDVLFYDWWPLVDERRQIARLLDALVSIRYEVGQAQREG
jgi:hypothetical protein